ncbi:MAG: hypothetical protein RMJ67_01255 [Elusimicrobiota bacterium]|nr:hypothetical protein [Endomicrobiia bacterium]MDW8165131.1 hypothetical protein [Elusimicrobiota bacterium]
MINQQILQRYNQLKQIFQSYIYNNHEGIASSNDKYFFYFFCQLSDIHNVLTLILNNQLYEHFIEMRKYIETSQGNEYAYYVAIKLQ